MTDNQSFNILSIKILLVTLGIQNNNLNKRKR